MANEKIDTTQNIITPPEGDREKEKRLLEALKAIPEEDIIKLWDEFDEEERQREEEEEKRKEEERRREEEKKWNLDPEKMSDELPEYTNQVKENFLSLKWIDKDKLIKIDKFVSEMEAKGYIKRCSYEWWLMVLIDIPWYPTFKYFEPNFEAHSIGGSYRWRFGPYCTKDIRSFWGKELSKSETKQGGTWLLPLRKSSDEWDNFALYNYIKRTMEENKFSFVSFHHDRKFLKILWDYYRKCTWDTSITTPELVAMRSRVLLSGWYWLQKNEWWFSSWVIECYDDHCGFNFMFWPDEFDYVSFLLTDLELQPEDYAGGYNTSNL